MGRSLRQIASGAPTELPFWLVAPGWFLSPQKGSRHRRLLSDLAFGQYCLFLAIRIHDDLLDDQARDRWLILAGDDLLIEPEEQFARQVDSAGPTVSWF